MYSLLLFGTVTLVKLSSVQEWLAAYCIFGLYLNTKCSPSSEYFTGSMRYLWSYTLKNPLWKLRIQCVVKTFYQSITIQYYFISFLWTSLFKKGNYKVKSSWTCSQAFWMIKKWDDMGSLIGLTPFCESQLIWVFRSFTAQSPLWSIARIVIPTWSCGNLGKSEFLQHVLNFYVYHALIINIWKYRY